jgi:outer membrane protein OmpA-like peptidoglycan-associated protein
LPPVTWGDIAGQVIDADSGAPLADVAVSLGTRSVRTDADGRFGPERIDAGPVNVAARKTGYTSGGANVDVAPAETTATTIRLEPIRIGTVVGKVVDARTGESVNGARVTLGRQAQETGANGSFRFEDVTTGAVGVAVRHADYGDGAASGDLEGGATLELLVRVDLRREDVTQLEAGLASGGTIDLYGIHFDSGKDQFKPSSLSTLNAVLEVMKRAPDRSFTIAGHTDSDGSDASNQDLSERRARTVIRWLIDHGIEARRLQGVGFGESQPTAPNETEAGKALNRRVQLSFAG